jgi:tyrosine-protein kinase Etk/Wzc
MQNQDNQNAAAAQAQMYDDEVNLMDVLLVIAKHNRFIIKFTASMAVLAITYALLQVNVYTAKVVILPPQQGSSSINAMLGQLGGLGSLFGGGGKSSSELFIGMLKSQALADKMIARLNLQQKFKAKTMEPARGALAGGTEIKMGKDGFITIEYSDGDPKFAATVANTYVEELDKLNASLALTETSRKRLFFERQLKLVRADLDAAENALKQTQERTGFVQPEKQGGAIIEAVANARAQIAANEIELTAMGAYATPQNPRYRQIQQMIVALRAQLTKLEANSSGRDIKVPTGKLPETGLEFVRKTRELKFQETLYELIGKQFEIAKIDEAKDAPLIQVIDYALVPEQISSPKRSLTVILATLMAFFIGVLLAFVRDASERASQDPASVERMNLLRRYLRRGA